MSPRDDQPTEAWSPDEPLQAGPPEISITPADDPNAAAEIDAAAADETVEWPVRPEARDLPIDTGVYAPEPFEPVREYVQSEEIVEEERPWFKRPSTGIPVVMGILALLGLLALLFAVGVFDREEPKPAERGGVVATNTTGLIAPALTGLTLARAKEQLKEVGIPLKEVRRIPDAKPAGVVLGQEPDAGSKLTGNEGISLIVSSGPERVAVPTVVGQKLAAAQATLKSQKLKSAFVGRFDSAPRNTVIAQVPEAGKKLRVGGTVKLITSKGPQMVVIPSVVGTNREQATATLSALGLRSSTQLVPSAKPLGQVLSQSPAASGKVAVGSVVKLQVANGASPNSGGTPNPNPAPTPTPTPKPKPAPTLVPVPETVGSARAEATNALRDAGFKMQTTGARSSEPSGTIISMNPVAGTELRKGSLVTMIVSSGPEPGAAEAMVPEVGGMTEEEARMALEGDGFVVEVVPQPTDTPSEEGTVVAQNPGGNMNGHQGDLVTIYIGTARS